MTARRSVLLQLLALALAIGMSLFALPFLGSVVPIHWGLSGRPDAWGSPAFALILTPLLLVGILGGTLAVIRSGKNVAIYSGLAFIAAWFVLEHGILLGASLRAFSPLRPLIALVFGLFFGISPIIGRVEQNPWMGVRTPWTLGSRRVWRETHRATARLWLVGGLAGSALTMFGAPIFPVLAFLVFLALYPVAISYFVWRRLGRP